VVSDWDNRISEHQIHGLIHELENLVRALPRPNDQAREDLARVERVVDYLSARLEQSDPRLLSPASLDSVVTPLRNAQPALQSYQQTADRSQLGTANNYLDQALINVAAWPPIVSAADVEALRESVTFFRRSAGQLLRSVQQEAIDAEQQLEKVRAELKQMAEALRREREQQSGALEGRIVELTSAVDSQKTRLDEAIAEYQRQFSSAQEQRSQTFEQSVRELSDRQAMVLKELEETQSQSSKTLSDRAEDLLRQLEEQREQAARIVGVIGQIGITGGYEEYASGQENEANRWRWAAVVSMLAVVGVAIWAFLGATEEAFSWQRFVARLAISIPLALIAGYSASQSAGHRRNERSARQSELQLAALDPYLALFGEQERNALKEKVALRFFGQHDSEVSGDSMPGVIQVLQVLKDIASEIRRG
jgi:hypothetical protein